MPNFSIPKLLPIDTRREDGFQTVPPMRWDFDIPGIMVLQSPGAVAYVPRIVYNGGYVLWNGQPILFTQAEVPDTGAEELAYNTHVLQWYGDALSYTE